MLIYLQLIETPEDKTKFETLYTEYKEWMGNIAFSILHNKQDAEDAVHNAFVKIAENIKKVDDPLSKKTRSYVVTIIETKSIDIYRKKQRHPEVPISEEDIGIHFDYANCGDLAKCISQLPPQSRAVLTLKYRHGYNNREIAKILKISEHNAIKIDQRAKANLKELCIVEGLL